MLVLGFKTKDLPDPVAEDQSRTPTCPARWPQRNLTFCQTLVPGKAQESPLKTSR